MGFMGLVRVQLLWRTLPTFVRPHFISGEIGRLTVAKATERDEGSVVRYQVLLEDLEARLMALDLRCAAGSKVTEVTATFPTGSAPDPSLHLPHTQAARLAEEAGSAGGYLQQGATPGVRAVPVQRECAHGGSHAGCRSNGSGGTTSHEGIIMAGTINRWIDRSLPSQAQKTPLREVWGLQLYHILYRYDSKASVL